MKKIRITGGLKGLGLVQLVMVVALFGLLCLVGMSQARADSQGMAVTMQGVTNLPAIVTTGANSNAINSWIPIRQGRGLALQAKYWASAGTSNNWFWLAPSVDGTNVKSTPWVWSMNANGTNILTEVTNWARGALDGYQWLVLVSQVNTNSGTITNGGVLYSYPNN